MNTAVYKHPEQLNMRNILKTLSEHSEHPLLSTRIFATSRMYRISEHPEHPEHII